MKSAQKETEIFDFIKVYTPVRVLYISEDIYTANNPYWICEKSDTCALLFNDKGISNGKLFNKFFTEKQFNKIITENTLNIIRIIKTINLNKFEDYSWRKYNYIKRFDK